MLFARLRLLGANGPRESPLLELLQAEKSLVRGRVLGAFSVYEVRRVLQVQGARKQANVL